MGDLQGVVMSEAKKPKTDWPAVERDYRSTNLTLRELAELHNCDHTSIAKMASRHKWSRDLTEAVKLATKAAVIEQTLANANRCQQDVTKTVSDIADINTKLILRHQEDLADLREIVQSAKQVVMSFGGRSVDLKEAALYVQAVNGLATANKTLIEQQRKVHGLDDQEKSKKDSLEDWLNELG